MSEIKPEPPDGDESHVVLRHLGVCLTTLADGEPLPAAAGFLPDGWAALVRRLALHNQPFGVTWEDVDRLRACADYAAGAYSNRDEVEHWEEQKVLLDDLAVRIAARLSPREP